MIPYCKATGVGLIPWAPLARGYLTRPPSDEADSKRKSMEVKMKNGLQNRPQLYELGWSETDRAIIKRVQEIAEKKGWSMATVSLAWINEKVSAPIVGMSSIKRVEEGTEATGKKLEPEEVKYLEELYQPRSILGHS